MVDIGRDRNVTDMTNAVLCLTWVVAVSLDKVSLEGFPAFCLFFCQKLGSCS